MWGRERGEGLGMAIGVHVDFVVTLYSVVIV